MPHFCLLVSMSISLFLSISFLSPLCLCVSLRERGKGRSRSLPHSVTKNDNTQEGCLLSLSAFCFLSFSSSYISLSRSLRMSCQEDSGETKRAWKTIGHKKKRWLQLQKRRRSRQTTGFVSVSLPTLASVVCTLCLTFLCLSSFLATWFHFSFYLPLFLSLSSILRFLTFASRSLFSFLPFSLSFLCRSLLVPFLVLSLFKPFSLSATVQLVTYGCLLFFFFSP